MNKELHVAAETGGPSTDQSPRNTPSWDHKDSWKHNVYRDGKQAAMVEVVRWSFGLPVNHWERGEHNWNVYAYLYENHPRFAAFVAAADDKYELTGGMPLHGGQTFFEIHYDKYWKPTSVQVGCDYMHYGDDEYRRLATKDEARSIFRDAEDLIEWCKS